MSPWTPCLGDGAVLVDALKPMGHQQSEEALVTRGVELREEVLAGTERSREAAESSLNRECAFARALSAQLELEGQQRQRATDELEAWKLGSWEAWKVRSLAPGKLGSWKAWAAGKVRSGQAWQQ